jgi:hypothetical protein
LRKPEKDRTDGEKIDREPAPQPLRRQGEGGLVKDLPQVVKYEAAKKAFEDYKGISCPA